MSQDKLPGHNAQTSQTGEAAAVDEVSFASVPVAPPAALPHRFLIFAIVALALMMSSVDLTIVSTALPTIGHDLGGYGLNWTSWIITMYGVGRVVVTPLVGRVSELLGTRAIFIVALVVFTLASLLCGLSQDLAMLIVLRAVQAVGGAAFMPSATALVADAFGPSRDRAVGAFSSIIPIGAIIGPVLGGVIVNYWSWRGVFLINVPIGLVLVAAATRLIPAVVPKASNKFDILGSAALCCGLLSVTLAITYLGEAGDHHDDALFWILAALTVLAAFTLLRRSDRPGAILPRRLLFGRGFGVMNIINLFYGASALGLATLVPVYAQSRYGMNSLEAGTLLTARGIGMILVAGLATLALRRTGYRPPMIIGYLLSSAGLVMLAVRAPAAVSVHWWLSVSALVVGIGMGIALPASSNASMQLDPTQIASITGWRVTLRQVGSITAVSITTALMNQSTDPGHTEATVFGVFAVMLIAVVMLVPFVPEHRSNW